MTKFSVLAEGILNDLYSMGSKQDYLNINNAGTMTPDYAKNDVVRGLELSVTALKSPKENGNRGMAPAKDPKLVAQVQINPAGDYVLVFDIPVKDYLKDLFPLMTKVYDDDDYNPWKMGQDIAKTSTGKKILKDLNKIEFGPDSMLIGKPKFSFLKFDKKNSEMPTPAELKKAAADNEEMISQMMKQADDYHARHPSGKSFWA